VNIGGANLAAQALRAGIIDRDEYYLNQRSWAPGSAGFPRIYVWPAWMAIACLDRGINVVSEKPLAATLAEGQVTRRGR
jgi:hypothetical protein